MIDVPSDVREKLSGLLRNRLRMRDPKQDLPFDASLQALGLDSMTAIDLLLDLEQTFGVVLPDSMLTAETFRTPATLAAAVLFLLEGKG
jgi:acyl carrier protein